jgi:hypothetical protein
MKNYEELKNNTTIRNGGSSTLEKHITRIKRKKESSTMEVKKSFSFCKSLRRGSLKERD